MHQGAHTLRKDPKREVEILVVQSALRIGNACVTRCMASIIRLLIDRTKKRNHGQGRNNSGKGKEDHTSVTSAKPISPRGRIICISAALNFTSFASPESLACIESDESIPSPLRHKDFVGDMIVLLVF